jgi:hypothetical protein
VWAVDRPLETVQLEPERSLVDPGRRGELGAEHSHADAPEAAQRSESFPVSPRQLDGGVPVRANAELLRGHAPAPFAGDKDDRHPLESARTPLEQALRRVRFHAADVDAVDPYAGGDALWGPCEYEPERGARDCQHEKCEHAALDAHARRSFPPAPGTRGNGP